MIPISTPLLQRTEKALRLLAEKWPERFFIDESRRELVCIIEREQGNFSRHRIFWLSQDDVDEILALIGIEYRIENTAGGWISVCWNNKHEWEHCIRGTTLNSKREAAYVCLCDVIETLYPKET